MVRTIAVLFMALLVCSCATTSVPYRELQEGDEQLGESALLALRVLIETTDTRFAAEKGLFRQTNPVLHLLRENDESYRTLDISLPMQPKDWQSIDGRYRYTRDVLLRIPIGTYFLRVFELDLGETIDVTSTTTWYRLWYPRTGFTLSDPRAYALGTLRLDLDEIDGTTFRDMKISSRLSLDQGADAIAANAAAIAERAPSLVGDVQPLAVHFAYSLITPQAHDDVLDRREDALWPNTSTDRIEAGFEGIRFYLRKKVSDDRLDWVRPATDQWLPADVDIEWDARLVNGEPGKRYGLMLGSDERNSYVFAATGDGMVMVMQVLDGAWQNRPLGPVPSAAHAMAGGEANRLLVSVRGNRILLSVNGKALGEFTSAFDLSPAFLAPCLESRGVLVIDRFRITEAQ